MRKLLILASTIAGALAFTTAAGASAPQRSTFTSHDHGVDTSFCGFPIVFDVTFETDASTFVDAQGNIVGLKLHQIVTSTFTANGVNLTESDHPEIFVDFVDGVPVLSKHVGVEFLLRGPNGRIALVTGQTVFEVVNGFDGPVLVQHGLQLEAAANTICAAFS